MYEKNTTTQLLKVLVSLKFTLNEIFYVFLFFSSTAHLHSKEDQCRDAAVIASKYLAQQCSNSQDVKDVLQHFFDILNGN